MKKGSESLKIKIIFYTMLFGLFWGLFLVDRKCRGVAAELVFISVDRHISQVHTLGSTLK